MQTVVVTTHGLDTKTEVMDQNGNYNQSPPGHKNGEAIGLESVHKPYLGPVISWTRERQGRWSGQHTRTIVAGWIREQSVYEDSIHEHYYLVTESSSVR